MKYYTRHWTCSGYKQLVGSCKYNNGNSGSVEGGESL